MGTTLTALTTGSGISPDFVIAIEGFESLITTGATAAALTAWSGSDHTSAIGGLQINGAFEQKFTAWEPKLDVSRLSFAVMPSANTAAGDTFGRLVFGQGAGVETNLTVALDCSMTTVTVQSTSSFASSGTIHIGREAIAYTGKTATTFTGCTRGKFAPFKAESEASQRFARPHRLPTVGDGISIAPKVTSLQRVWKGRIVGIWAHRVVGGVLDVKAQAECIWAGIITDTRDEANGMTYVDCEDIRAMLRDCVMMRDQFTCRVAEGMVLKAGWRFDARDWMSTGSTLYADALVVVSSGAAGDNEINAGTFTRSQLLDALNNWISAEKGAGRLNFQWQFGTSDYHTVITASATAVAFNSFDFAAPNAVLNFLGFTQGGPDGNTGTIDHQWPGLVVGTLTSGDEAYRIYTSTGGNFDIENIRGTWWDNEALLPPSFGDQIGSVAVLQMGGGPMAIFRYVDANTLVCVGGVGSLDNIAGMIWDDSTSFRRVLLSNGADLTLRQVAVIQHKFKWLMTMTACSTGTASYNYADPLADGHGDNLPAQLGAGIPWALLGANWLASVASLDEITDSLTLVIEKPTKWSEVFGADLVARLIHIIWKPNGTGGTSSGGGLIARTWGTPTSARSLHTFVEASKHAPAGTNDVRRTVAEQTSDYLVNSIKLDYGRSLSGGYRSSVNIVAPASQDEYGARPVTLSMRNTTGTSGYDAQVEELADGLAMTAAVFLRPLHIIRRPISLPYYVNCAPGDFCTVTDLFTRNPADGSRGLSSKPGLITRVRVDFGGREIDTRAVRPPSGEVDILLLPITNISPYSPAATLASYAGSTITCTAHDFSESSEAADATRFPAGSQIYIHETDPDDPTSFLAWDRIVDSQSGNNIVLTSALSAPAYDAAKTYRVVSSRYDNTITAQKADVYQADDADGMVLDTVGYYVYGNDPEQATTWTENDPDSTRPRLYSNTQYGDGRPLDVGGEHDIATLCNVLVNQRTTSLFHSLANGSAKSYTGTGSKILDIIPVHLGPGELVLGERYVRIGVWAASTDGTSTTITVSLCSRPPIGSSLETTDLTAPLYSMAGAYETWTSAAITATTFARFQSDFSIRSIDSATGIGYVVVEVKTKCAYRGICEGLTLRYDEAA